LNLHEKQQFDFLLAHAVERFVERLEQRNEGAENALGRLRSDPNGEGVWLNEFTRAVFRDFLLDNVDGYCFILCALSRRKGAAPNAGTVEESLAALAQQVFADLLSLKSQELLEQHLAVA